MPFTRGAREVPNQTPASTSDARKRKAERDGSNWHPIELTDGERKFLAESTATLESKVERIIGLRLAGKESLLDPPPVEPAPWERLSTDRDQPTDAYVSGVPGRYWRSGRALWMVAEDGNHYCLPDLTPGTDVELLHTYSPETHVPVERALIERADSLVRAGVLDMLGDKYLHETADLLKALAALADGAES